MTSAKTPAFKKTQIIAGEYHLHNVQGTASSIKLKADSTFDFFYSYSAIDRTGSGTYTVKDNLVTLSSNPRSEKDFKLANSKRNYYKGVTIKIADKDDVMSKYVSCCIATKHGMQRAQTNDKGIAQFPQQHADSIILIHLIFPDRTSIFQVVNKRHNYFEFTIEPHIVNVYFNNLTLKIINGELKGGHPLLGGDQFHYARK